MSNIITFDYVKQLLDKPTLSFIDFQTILSYLYKKLQIILNCKLKKEVINHSINLINDVIAMMEVRIKNEEIDKLDLRDTMIELIKEFEKELEKVLDHGK